MTDSKHSAENAKDNYAGVYENRIGFGVKPALILVDFVQAYFDQSSDLYADVESALESALRLVNIARAKGITIIYTNVTYQASGIDGGVFYKKAKPLKNFLKDSPMGAWPKGLQPLENELVISKQYPSAFFGTSLAATLTASGIDTLIITGLTTSGCVRATCVDAVSNGFVPVIVRDACGDRHEAPHEANLFDMNAKYGDVVDESAVIDFLSGFARSGRNDG